MSRLKPLTRRDYLLAFIPFGCALLVYALTTCPTVFSEDCGEFIFGAYTLGVLHPPGYPLYALLGKLFTFLPFNTIAWRINFYSGFCTAGAVYFLYLSGRKFNLHPMAIGSAVLGMAFGKNVWSQSIVAEVYALNLFFVCVTLFVMLQWLHCKENKYIYMFSLLYGLALCDHQVIGIFIPFYIIVILINDPRFFPEMILGALGSYFLGMVFGKILWFIPVAAEMYISIFLFCMIVFLILRREKYNLTKSFQALFYAKRFWISLLLFILGLSVYLYLPIRANSKPFLNWGNPYNWDNFWFHVRRSVYNPDIKMTLSDYVERLKVLWYYFDLLVSDFTWIYFFLGLFGVYHFMKKNFRWGLFTLLLFLVGGVGLVIIHKSTYSANTRFVIRVFFFQSYPPFAILAAFGIEFFLDRIRKFFYLRELSPHLKWTYYTAAALLPIIPLTTNWSYNDLSDNYFCYDYAKSIMDTMEPNAIMYAAGDMIIFTLVYLQLVENYRLDVTIYDNFSVFHDNFMGFDFYKGIIPDPEEERIRQRTYAKTIEKYYGKRPIYFYNAQNLRYKTGFVTLPEGLIFRVHKRGDPVRRNKYWWNIYKIRGVNEERHLTDQRINPFICDYHIRKARFYLSTNQPKKAAEAYALVKKTKNLNAMTEVALYWLNNKAPGYALNILRETLKIDDTVAVNYFNIGLALSALNEKELAAETFQKFLTRWQGAATFYERAYRQMRTHQNKPLSAMDFNNIGVRYMWKGEYHESIKRFQNGLKVKPTHPLIFLNLALCFEMIKDIAKSSYYYQIFLQNWQGEERYRVTATQGLERLRTKAGATPKSIQGL